MIFTVHGGWGNRYNTNIDENFQSILSVLYNLYVHSNIFPDRLLKIIWHLIRRFKISGVNKLVSFK